MDVTPTGALQAFDPVLVKEITQAVPMRSTDTPVVFVTSWLHIEGFVPVALTVSALAEIGVAIRKPKVSAAVIRAEI